jgi:DNA-binding transcriptional ArsR family regulator
MKIKAKRMHAAAEAASTLLKALANRHRLLILCHLIEREHSVSELAQRLALRDSAVSQHLAMLRREGLVAARREGQMIFYSVRHPSARKLIGMLYSLYCGKP